MRSSPLKFKTIDYILSAFVLSFFLSCDEKNPRSEKNNPAIAQVKEIKGNQAQIFLTYIDSVLKLPEAKFNENGIRSLNKNFLSELPLVMHDPAKKESEQNITVQYYSNKKVNHTADSEFIYLIPEAIADSLAVGDFTGNFGHVETEKPLIGVTAQPQPVFIQVSSKRAIKLTFRNNENQNQAVVTMVQVLNFR